MRWCIASVFVLGCGRLEFAPRLDPDGAVGEDGGIDGSDRSDGDVVGMIVRIGDHAGGTGSTRDTMLVRSRPTENYGAHPDVHLDATDQDARPLMWFDVSSVGGVVISARLLCWVKVSNFGPTSVVTLHRVTEAWAEGAGNFEDGIANHTERLVGVAWTSPGAAPPSRDATAVGSWSGNAVVGDMLEFVVDPALVQQWIDAPSSNLGVALVGSQMGYSELHSREAADSMLRPILELELAP